MCGKRRGAVSNRRATDVSDRTFEWSVIGLSVATLVWIVLGIAMQILSTPWVIVIGLVVWLAGSGALLYYWGKAYMSRM